MRGSRAAADKQRCQTQAQAGAGPCYMICKAEAGKCVLNLRLAAPLAAPCEDRSLFPPVWWSDFHTRRKLTQVVGWITDH